MTMLAERRILQGKLFGGKDGSSATLPEICLALRAGMNGSADPWPNEEIARVSDFLRMVLDTWMPSNDPVDGAVQLMVIATLEYVRREFRERG